MGSEKELAVVIGQSRLEYEIYSNATWILLYQYFQKLRMPLEFIEIFNRNGLSSPQWIKYMYEVIGLKYLLYY